MEGNANEPANTGVSMIDWRHVAIRGMSATDFINYLRHEAMWVGRFTRMPDTDNGDGTVNYRFSSESRTVAGYGHVETSVAMAVSAMNMDPGADDALIPYTEADRKEGTIDEVDR